MSYIGNTPTQQNFVAGADQFSGNGSTVAFTLSRSVNTVFDIFVTVANVPQDPFTAYTVSGNTLTFDGAPPSGTNNIDVVYRATNVQTFVPTPGVSTQLGLGSASAPSLTFIGDTNTGIYSPGADTVAIGTGGTEALRVNSSQNVGIGTSSPGAGFKLDVVGNSRSAGVVDSIYTGTTSGSQLGTFRMYGTGSGVTGEAQIRAVLDTGSITAANLQFYTGTSERVRITSGGQFLLGATALTANGFFTNAGTSAALTSVSGTNLRAWAQTYNASASNNATVDAWLGRDAAGNVFGNSLVVGHFYVYVNGASGANGFSGVYSIITTGNGTIAATLAAVSTVTRGTSPVLSVQIANDGAGGAIKLTITYINNSGVVTGGASRVTFIGQIA